MTERVLVTGASGRIGGYLRQRLARPGRTLRLLDIATPEDVGADEELVTASVTDLDALVSASAGADAVVHLGGHSGEEAWDHILATNIHGTYVVFEAARRAGVPRVVFASSNHAAGFHPAVDPVPDDLPPRPDTYYGVSKVAGEALGSLYHDRYGLDVVCLRIGTCRERPPPPARTRSATARRTTPRCSPTRWTGVRSTPTPTWAASSRARPSTPRPERRRPPRSGWPPP